MYSMASTSDELDSPFEDRKDRSASSSQRLIELSVVLPCLNESETVGVCVQKAISSLQEAGIAGEVIVADNGSSDGSIEIAEAGGARVVAEIGRAHV